MKWKFEKEHWRKAENNETNKSNKNERSKMVLKMVEMEDGQRRFSLHIVGIPGRKGQTQGQNKYLKLYSRKLSRNERKVNNHIKMAHHVVQNYEESYILWFYGYQ